MGLPTKIQCYSGRTYADCPISFSWQGYIYKVEKIEKYWQEPGEKHFRVRTKDDNLFEICYHELRDEWSATELI